MQRFTITKQFLLFLIMLALTACGTMEPVPLSPTATPIPPTATATLTLTPTLTTTPSPTATPTPEIAKPTQSLESLVPAGSPDHDNFMRIINNQFIEGLEQDSNGRYTFLCVSTAPEIPAPTESGFTTKLTYHNPPIQLPGGFEISHTLPCQYIDANGQEQIVEIPAFMFNRTEVTGLIIGSGIATQDNIKGLAAQINSMANDPNGVIPAFMGMEGYTGQGSIVLVYAGMPTGDIRNDTEGEYLREVIEELYTPEILAEFARTGDPAVLAQPGLLLPVRVSFRNAFAVSQ